MDQLYLKKSLLVKRRQSKRQMSFLYFSANIYFSLCNYVLIISLNFIEKLHPEKSFIQI